MLSNEPYQHNKNEKSSGDYFDMISRIESVGGDSKQSLKNLAEKLKSAREMVQMPIIQPVEKHVIQNNFQNSEKENPVLNSNSTEITIKHTEEISENNAKRLIIAHKYADAIEILRALNLNNPKKSVYFADQIRFLEKVLANSKK
jgi:ribosomal protein L15